MSGKIIARVRERETRAQQVRERQEAAEALDAALRIVATSGSADLDTVFWSIAAGVIAAMLAFILIVLFLPLQ